jgi:glycerophosphoryl diester phosphodiesterase
VEPLRRPPITFAHRGGRAHARENTLDAFRLALEMGACGLESDVWLTADGVPVLHHDDRVRMGVRRPRVTALPRAALPAHVPTLEELYAACGSDFELSLDVKDPAAASAAVDIARAASNDGPGRLWLCHPDPELLAAWRSTSSDVRLVNSTRVQRMPRGPERRAAQLAEGGIDAVNLHYREWTGGMTTLFHRFGRLAFAWDAQHERMVRELVAMGCDAVYSDHVDRMVMVVGRNC